MLLQKLIKDQECKEHGLKWIGRFAASFWNNDYNNVIGCGFQTRTKREQQSSFRHNLRTDAYTEREHRAVFNTARDEYERTL